MLDKKPSYRLPPLSLQHQTGAKLGDTMEQYHMVPELGLTCGDMVLSPHLRPKTFFLADLQHPSAMGKSGDVGAANLAGRKTRAQPKFEHRSS